MQDTAGEARTSSLSDVLLWSTHMAEQGQDDQLELTYSSYVRTQDVTLKTCWRRWMIGRRGERGSRISVLAARHDDDDDLGVPFLLNTSRMSRNLAPILQRSVYAQGQFSFSLRLTKYSQYVTLILTSGCWNNRDVRGSGYLRVWCKALSIGTSSQVRQVSRRTLPLSLQLSAKIQFI